VSPLSHYLFDSAMAGAPPSLSYIYSESVKSKPRGPGGGGGFLNTRLSYLKFKVQNTGTDAGHTITADFNIASIFSRLELYHGSNLLDHNHEYGLLVTFGTIIDK